MSSKRKRQPVDKTRTRRARRAPANTRNKGIRPWILPGLAGLAVIAIALVGVIAISSDDSNAANAARVPSPAIGQRSAQVVIHEYADYQCPFCGVFARSIKPELQERFIDTGIVRIVWHDFAWYGDESRRAANAARCAGDQGQFWEYHDVLFDNQRGTNSGTFSRDNLKRFGEAMGLEPEAFGTCVDNDTYAGAIDTDMRAVRRLGLNGTPSFTIGDQRIVGAQPVEVFEQAIAAELRQQG
jgi:protein-disulfide isomerase